MSTGSIFTEHNRNVDCTDCQWEKFSFWPITRTKNCERFSKDFPCMGLKHLIYSAQPRNCTKPKKNAGILNLSIQKEIKIKKMCAPHITVCPALFALPFAKVSSSEFGTWSNVNSSRKKERSEKTQQKKSFFVWQHNCETGKMTSINSSAAHAHTLTTVTMLFAVYFGPDSTVNGSGNEKMKGEKDNCSVYKHVKYFLSRKREKKRMQRRKSGSG